MSQIHRLVDSASNIERELHRRLAARQFVDIKTPMCNASGICDLTTMPRCPKLISRGRQHTPSGIETRHTRIAATREARTLDTTAWLVSSRRHARAWPSCHPLLAIAILPTWARADLRLPYLPVTEQLVIKPIGQIISSTIRWATSGDFVTPAV